MIAKNGAILLGVSLASALLGYYISTTQTVELSPVRTKSRSYTTDPPDVKKLVVVTRIHQQEASNMIDIDRVVSFVEASLKYASKVFVCTGPASSGNYLYWNELKARLSALGYENSTEVITIDPWGGFTHALNVATQCASDQKFEIIAFQSLEVTMTREIVFNLLDYFKDSDTLLVGPTLQGHLFKPGVCEISGRTCPWNTFALWDIRKLQLTGFPLIGNGNRKLDISGGVEEVTTVSLLQYMNPAWRAYLVNTSGLVDWDTRFADPKRAEWHEKKMSSKDLRPAAQMKVLGIPSGKTEHVHMKNGR